MLVRVVQHLRRLTFSSFLSADRVVARFFSRLELVRTLAHYQNKYCHLGHLIFGPYDDPDPAGRNVLRHNQTNVTST